MPENRCNSSCNPTVTAIKGINRRFMAVAVKINCYKLLCTVKEGRFMFVLSNLDFELIKLIGWCKDISVNTLKKYNHTIFSDDRLKDIIYRGYIRLTKDRRSYRLTHEGYELLHENGLNFHEDKNPISAGRTLERRHMVADIIVMLYFAGIDVFTDDTDKLYSNSFLPAFALRRKYDKSENIVGATRFAGIIKAETKALIPYYIESGNEKLFAGTERSVFCAVGALSNCNDDYEIIFIGNNLNLLYKSLEYKVKKRACNMAKAVDEFALPIKLAPANQNGVFQLQLIKTGNWKSKILSVFRNTSSDNNFFDGMINEEPVIIGLDFDIRKVKQAVRESKNTILNIICFEFQTECYRGISENIRCLPVKEEVIAEILDITHTEYKETFFVGKE